MATESDSRPEERKADTAGPDLSVFAPLRSPLFWAMRVAGAVPNVGTGVQTVGAAWLMADSSSSGLMVALVQAATSLPVFLLALPAGALTDTVDRRLLMVVGGLPDDVRENYAYEYDANFRFVKKHTLASGHTHLGIQTATFADGHWWFGCYDKPKTDTTPSTPPILLKADASLKKVERFEFDCSLGIVSVGDRKFLVARGGSTKDKGYTGRLVLAVPDTERGLKLMEKETKK